MKIRAMLMACALFFAAAAAQAGVTFTATTTTTGGRPLNGLLVGDTITIDLRISSTGTPAVAGVGASARDYSATILDFVSGNAVVSFLHDACVPSVGCFNGLDNQVGGALNEGLDQPAVGPYVRFANAASTTARSGTGAQDPGLNGVVGGGDAQFRLVFTTLAAGNTTIALGTRSTEPILGDAIITPGGGVEDATNVLLNISVPEPTAIAAGLAGVVCAVGAAGIRRRL